MKNAFWICLAMLTFSVASQATVYTSVTPPGSQIGPPGGSVSDSATFTTGPGTITVVLTNFEANPSNDLQALSGIDFVLSSSATGATLTLNAGNANTTLVINTPSKTFTTGTTGSSTNYWGVTVPGLPGSKTIDLSANLPKYLLIGPPDGTGHYTAANSSLTNGSHSPLLDQTATFTITGLANVTSATTITSVTFLFGTAGTALVTGETGSSTPEPATYLMLGTGLVGLAFLRKARKS